MYGSDRIRHWIGKFVGQLLKRLLKYSPQKSYTYDFQAGLLNKSYHLSFGSILLGKLVHLEIE